MTHEIKKYLFDIGKAISNIESFLTDKKYEDYEQSSLLQAAVERKFEIIGEALNRIKILDSEFVKNITDYRKIIGLRKLISNGYDIIESDTVWSATKNRLPKLKEEVTIFLN